ncbi:MAG: butyrate kinase, partial [Firmicutes bacterium]|nr:butyrate kinase [Bacillota bacterium]
SAKDHPLFDHVSNIGAALAYRFAQGAGCKAYIYDAVSAETMVPEAKVLGMDHMERTSLCHVLNARAMSIKYAKEQGRRYEDMNLIVAHMGGGITVSAHSHGRIVDNVRDDEGPMSPTSSGAVSTQKVVDLCYSGKYTYEEATKKVRGDAGLVNLLGTHNAREVEKRIAEGDEYAKLVYDAMGYQVAKYSAMMAGCFTEPVDAVILTGGIAHSKMLTGVIRKYLEHTFNVVVMPGENEMEALAFGGLRILRGEETANPAYV